MRQLNETTNISIEERFDVNTGHPSVIQKGNVTKSNVYALQLWDEQEVIKVFKGTKANPTNCKTLVFWGTKDAGKHTQTFEFANAGDQHHWFIGTKPVNNWCTQIARIDLTKQNVSKPHTTNLDFPRLAHLNRIGDQPYEGGLMYRVEAAVSPDYQKMLIMTVDKNYTAHFTFYDLPTINQELDRIESNIPAKRYVSMENVPVTIDNSFQSFSVDNFYNPDDVSGKKNNGSTTEITNSIQGVDIDNAGNIYISCQPSPSTVNGKYIGHHKQIIKIPYYAHQNVDQWTSVNLSEYAKQNVNTFDISNYRSEVESIQIISENYGYLTISYHRSSDGKTEKSKIYKIRW
ncbi:MAG: helveticin J family class III bacteriocin [Thomasclavelia ramosa]|uniref:Helveticin n=1 Tax=Lactobacillus kalixensis DSM 16043 TaxID=1423763 RepID=A0A0R1U640_9LACO|nr:helveticin J family class III bacteriocin [Lactobacillus kalixensis]KRL88697.1 helveticin [Lactobacillus kalixensis DSM 16043]